VRRSRGDSESEGKREPGLGDLDAEHLLLTVNTVVDPSTLGVERTRSLVVGVSDQGNPSSAIIENRHGVGVLVGGW